jgi:hypothetical protein
MMRKDKLENVFRVIALPVLLLLKLLGKEFSTCRGDCSGGGRACADLLLNINSL